MLEICAVAVFMQNIQNARTDAGTAWIWSSMTCSMTSLGMDTCVDIVSVASTLPLRQRALNDKITRRLRWMVQLGQRLTGVMARCALYQGFSEDLTAESRRMRLFHTCGLQATTPRSCRTESMLALISKQLWNRVRAVQQTTCCPHSR